MRKFSYHQQNALLTQGKLLTITHGTTSVLQKQGMSCKLFYSVPQNNWQGWQLCIYVHNIVMVTVNFIDSGNANMGFNHCVAKNS
jgi:hypothetical protein